MGCVRVSEGSRWGVYNGSEGSRWGVYDGSEGSRWGVYVRVRGVDGVCPCE